ncbi:MAG: acpP [Acidimicrobiales bacterium]|nr:acpP [Acidimicrobiales bacterium]
MEIATFEWVRDRFAEVLELDPAEISKNSRFADDLDADSIDLIEVVNSAEHSLGVTMAEEELYDLETVGQLVDAIDRHRAAATDS